jgi:hypothetical protein
MVLPPMDDSEHNDLVEQCARVGDEVAAALTAMLTAHAPSDVRRDKVARLKTSYAIQFVQDIASRIRAFKSAEAQRTPPPKDELELARVVLAECRGYFAERVSPSAWRMGMIAKIDVAMGKVPGDEA